MDFIKICFIGQWEVKKWNYICLEESKIKNMEQVSLLGNEKEKGKGKCERSDVRLEEIRPWENYCLT